MAIVGMHGGVVYGTGATDAIAGASLLVGSGRHLSSVPVHAGQDREDLGTDMGAALDRIGARRDAGQSVCVLTSGDPGFFGLVRLASARFGPEGVRVFPAPSSVALAFARLGVSWDDAAVLSAHGRHPEAAVDAVQRGPKVAVLCSPATPPQALGEALLQREGVQRRVAVGTRLGEADEQVWHGDIAALARGSFDPLSVAVFLAPERSGPGVAWGRPEEAYAHRAGMITKAEVRAVALGKLSLPAAGVMWDVGAGSGSVSAECARLAPGLRIFAVERRVGDIPALRSNLAGTAATPVEGEAPSVLAELPDPDRAFVGGGGLDVLDAVQARLRPGGSVVATYASPGRAEEAARRLGHMVQISVSRAAPLGPDGALRLAAENPVFVCWSEA